MDHGAQFDERIALLRQLAVIGDKLVDLAGNLEQQPLDEKIFNELFRERQECVERICAIDPALPDDASIDKEQLDEMLSLAERIAAADKTLLERISQETESLKRQISEQQERKKSMLTYGVNILARKNMIVDEEK